ncbi:MAG: class I SAM-dependent methyltransferase [bacterium]
MSEGNLGSSKQELTALRATRYINNLLIGPDAWEPLPSLSWNGTLWSSDRSIEISYPSDGQTATDSTSPGWWFEARASLVDRYLGCTGPHRSIWDVGGGGGVMAECLRARGCAPVVVVEPMRSSARLAVPRADAVFASAIEDIALPRGTLSAVLLLDVIEHLADPAALLDIVVPLIAETGVLIVTVPAHMSLWSEVDKASGHYRRYSRNLLQKTMENSALRVIAMRHVFASMYLPAFVARRFGARKSPSEALASDRRRLHPNKLVDRCLHYATSMEGKLPAALAPRFGTSLLAVARPRQ